MNQGALHKVHKVYSVHSLCTRCKQCVCTCTHCVYRVVGSVCVRFSGLGEQLGAWRKGNVQRQVYEMTPGTFGVASTPGNALNAQESAE